MQKIVSSKIAIIFLVFFSGCQHIAKSPLGKEMTEDDFKVITSVPEQNNICQNSISPVRQKFFLPENYKRIVSINVTKKIPINNILERVGQLLDIDIQVDKNLSNESIFMDFCATNRRFIDILERLCSIAGLRYRIQNNFLLIEKDLPFVKNYNVQFLNFTRSSQNSIFSATDIFANSIDHKRGKKSNSLTNSNEGNGSNTSVKMNGENDFWAELEVNLESLLYNGYSGSDKPHFTIHKQAGVVSVFGTTEQHNCVESYLDVLQKSVSSQILIEAKVIEVKLNEEFKSGIEWGRIKPEDGAEGKFSFGGNYTNGQSSYNQNVSPNFFHYSGFNASNGLYGLLKNLQKFGNTRTLSSPRLTVMNNQIAVLKVAKNHVYFKMNYNRHFYTKTDQSEVSVGSDIQTVPIGLVMSVQPAIDPANKSVILFLRPTISRLVDSVSDPSVFIAHSSQNTTTEAPESKVPVIEVKEIDSVLRLKDGEVGILGGLMETQSSKDQGRNPLLGKVPLVKELFSSSDQNDRVTEIVILIKVKILDSALPDKADERLVHMYTNDPRPFL